ncbi:MAG: hypothetical protein MJ230_02770 [bacterium]|nr:hypothetical protein [bacterium]
MKITKFLPIVIALALVCPAFAEDQKLSDTSTLNLTLSKFCRVTSNLPSDTATATFDAEYKVITLGKAMAPSFHIVTNDPAQTIKVSALTAGKDALYKVDANTYGLAFANTTTGHIPDASAIADITAAEASPAIASNPDVIGFKFTNWTMTPSATYGGAITSDTKGQNLRTYVLENGTYDLSMTLNTTQEEGTFSTHDAAGTYTTVITVLAEPSA